MKPNPLEPYPHPEIRVDLAAVADTFGHPGGAGSDVVATIPLVIERHGDSATLRIQGHDQVLARFDGANALGNARQALIHVQRAIVKYAYQAAFVYSEMVAREAERVRLEAQMRSVDSSITKLAGELRTMTEY